MTALLIALAASIGAALGFVTAAAMTCGKSEDEYGNGYRAGRAAGRDLGAIERKWGGEE